MPCVVLLVPGIKVRVVKVGGRYGVLECILGFRWWSVDPVCPSNERVPGMREGRLRYRRATPAGTPCVVGQEDDCLQTEVKRGRGQCCRWKRGEVEGPVRCTAACPGNPSTNAKTSGDHFRIGSWARTRLETAAPKATWIRSTPRLHNGGMGESDYEPHDTIRVATCNPVQIEDRASHCATTSVKHPGSRAWNWAISGASYPALLRTTDHGLYAAAMI